MPQDRQSDLIQLLEERGEMKVADLAEALGTSPATIRRDLCELEAIGKLARTFGGAAPSRGTSLLEQTFHAKRERARAEKERIALRAAELVQPGMVVALDSGTTTWRLAAALKGKAPLTVLTNALAPVEELGMVDGIQIRVSGGNFRRENLDFVGPAAAAAFAGMYANLAFLSGDSFIPGRGLFACSETAAEVGKAIARCAEKIVVLMDHAKFHPQGCYQVLPSDAIYCLVTDAGLDKKNRELLACEKFETIVAE